jgi:hypothetical protein
MENNKKELTKKYFLRVKAKHPDGRFQIQGHKLTRQFGEFQLTAAEEKELKGDGCKAWVEVGTPEQAKADFDLRKKLKTLDKEI